MRHDVEMCSVNFVHMNQKPVDTIQGKFTAKILCSLFPISKPLRTIDSYVQWNPGKQYEYTLQSPQIALLIEVPLLWGIGFPAYLFKSKECPAYRGDPLLKGADA